MSLSSVPSSLPADAILDALSAENYVPYERFQQFCAELQNRNEIQDLSHIVQNWIQEKVGGEKFSPAHESIVNLLFPHLLADEEVDEEKEIAVDEVGAELPQDAQLAA